MNFISRKNTLTSARLKENITFGIGTTLIGAILGWVVNEISSQINSISLWLLLLVSLVSIITCFIVWHSSKKYTTTGEEMVKQIKDVNERTRNLVESYLLHSARIIPREMIYPEMAKCIREAKEEVAVVTYFMYDWSGRKRTFTPDEEKLMGRDDFYDAITECIERPNVEYVRIWQVPTEKKAEALEVIMESNPNHKKEIKKIQKISKNKPDQARLVIADQHTTASFILVDKRNLFINIDFYDHKKNVWYSPYMIFIKDTTGKSFQELKSIIVRLSSIT